MQVTDFELRRKSRDLNVTIPQRSLELTKETMRRLLRLKLASEYLSLSPWKIRRLIQEGKLPVVQDCEGGPFLLDIRDLDGFVERNKRTETF